MDLKQFVIWILTGGGAGFIAYALVESVPFLKALAADYKRYVSLALISVLSGGTWALTIWLGWTAMPATPQAWLESVFSVVATALLTAKTVHGFRDLRPKRLAAEGK
jgi:hypothetical protein